MYGADSAGARVSRETTSPETVVCLLRLLPLQQTQEPRPQDLGRLSRPSRVPGEGLCLLDYQLTKSSGRLFSDIPKKLNVCVMVV